MLTFIVIKYIIKEKRERRGRKKMEEKVKKVICKYNEEKSEMILKLIEVEERKEEEEIEKENSEGGKYRVKVLERKEIVEESIEIIEEEKEVMIVQLKEMEEWDKSILEELEY